MEWTDILHADTNSRKLKVISMTFEWTWSEMGKALGHEILKSSVSKNEFMNSADFLHVGWEAVIFGWTNFILYIFDF